MKLQYLIVIFAIIIIPITMVLTQYVHVGVETLTLQTSYDNKLSSATYGALKSFQLNTNNTYSDIVTEKIRYVQASVNTFFNTLGGSFLSRGYNEETIKTFIPALVYTLYDGYYIYTATYNEATGEYEHALKPYIYYSEQFEVNGETIVVNYTLDNYITIYGVLKDEDENGIKRYCTKSGYLIDISGANSYDDLVTNHRYSGLNIGYEDDLEETIITIDADTGNLIKDTLDIKYYNNTKYYKYSGAWGRITGQGFEKINEISDDNGNIVNLDSSDTSAQEYLKDAYNFTKWVTDNLKNVSMDVGGTNYKIFDFSDPINDPENKESMFNEHRRQVIKNSIESNLVSTMESYNKTIYNYKMPEITDPEWDMIIENICIVSFMQGLPIGGRYYNGYNVVANNQNKEHINVNSVYITDVSANTYHKPTCEVLDDVTNLLVGYMNIEYKLNTFYTGSGNTEQANYYYPRKEFACYKCIVTSSDERYDSISDVTNDKVKKAYYTALFRERYNSYKINTFYNDM